MWTLPSCRSRRAALLAFSALTLLVLNSARAQAPAEKNAAGKLAAVEFTGSTKFTQAQLAEAAGLAVGQTIRRTDFQAAADHLSELGWFANVQYRFSAKGNDVKLEFQLEDAHTVPVSFDNFPWFTDDEMTQAVKKDVPLFDGTSPTTGNVPNAIASALAKLLDARKLPDTVEHTLVETTQDPGTVQRFTITGVSIKIASIEFTDSLAKNDHGLEASLSALVGKPYSRYQVALFNFEQVRPLYLQHGFLRVRFPPAQVRFTGAPQGPVPDSILVVDPIEPGVLYTWGGVTWSGHTILTAQDLNRLVDLKPGDTADGVRLQAMWERVRTEYARRGYLEASIQPDETFDATRPVASYRAAITEGRQYRMGDLVLTGLSVEGERRIRAAWKIPAGDVLDRTYFDDFVEKGAKEALGDLPLHYDQIGHWLRTNPQTGTADALLDFH
jgi:outer membrane protein insertion porin family